MLVRVVVPAAVAVVDQPLKFVNPAGAVAAPVPPLATGKVPVTPVDKGSPVTLVATKAAGVPKPIALPDASSYKALFAT